MYDIILISCDIRYLYLKLYLLIIAQEVQIHNFTLFHSKWIYYWALDIGNIWSFKFIVIYFSESIMQWLNWGEYMSFVSICWGDLISFPLHTGDRMYIFCNALRHVIDVSLCVCVWGVICPKKMKMCSIFWKEEITWA